MLDTRVSFREKALSDLRFPKLTFWKDCPFWERSSVSPSEWVNEKNTLYYGLIKGKTLINFHFRLRVYHKWKNIFFTSCSNRLDHTIGHCSLVVLLKIEIGWFFLHNEQILPKNIIKYRNSRQNYTCRSCL